jgi:hypothetical protein
VTYNRAGWSERISLVLCIGDSYRGIRTAEHGTSNISDRDCALACVKAGGKYVFVRKGTVYKIDNQDYAGLEEHAGHTVRLTGEMSSDTIRVSNIESAGQGK